ncbi:hypothetical protein [Flavobacterium sp.]|uniref:hypothetical protein n=1 Tax=Flavobacterium sp. TaxID=239 RepID=UPI003753BB17
MKNFKQICFLSISIFSLFINQANAQKKAGDFRLGFGFNGGISLTDTFDFSLGLDGRLQYDISLKTSLAATTGYTHLFDNEVKGLGFVPAKIGFKSFFGDQFYVLGEVGAAIGTKSGMGTSFLWAPGIGVATKHIDVSLRYENYNKFDAGQVSIRFAYGYKL